MQSHKPPIAIFGIPRSGTTWLARSLSFAEGTKYLHEPDNEKNAFLGFYHKSNLHRFPYVRSHEKSNALSKLFSHALYKPVLSDSSGLNNWLFKIAGTDKDRIEQQLTRGSKGKNARSELAYFIYNLLPKDIGIQERRIVKFVHSLMLLPFLLENFNFVPLVLLRHPASVVSSMLKLKMPDRNRNLIEHNLLWEDYLAPYRYKINALKSPLELAGLQVSIFYFLVQEFLENSKQDIGILYYEVLCNNPEERFKELYHLLGLPWDAKVKEKIRNNNRPGEGYATQRVAHRQPLIWRKRLNSDQIAQIRRGYSSLPVRYYLDFIV